LAGASFGIIEEEQKLGTVITYPYQYVTTDRIIANRSTFVLLREEMNEFLERIERVIS